MKAAWSSPIITGVFIDDDASRARKNRRCIIRHTNKTMTHSFFQRIGETLEASFQRLFYVSEFGLRDLSFQICFSSLAFSRSSGRRKPDFWGCVPCIIDTIWSQLSKQWHTCSNWVNFGRLVLLTGLSSLSNSDDQLIAAGQPFDWWKPSTGAVTQQQ